MTMRHRSLMLVVVALVGCASTAKYEAVLNSWIAAKESDLVTRWGPPANVYERNGTRMLTYYSQRQVVMPGASPTYTTQVIGKTAYTSSSGGFPAQSIGLQCRTTFEIKEDRVSNWSYEGNDCISK